MRMTYQDGLISFILHYEYVPEVPDTRHHMGHPEGINILAAFIEVDGPNHTPLTMPQLLDIMCQTTEYGYNVGEDMHERCLDHWHQCGPEAPIMSDLGSLLRKYGQFAAYD
jgi:hypothetical protein